ncbi:hypothetical protein TcWFU_005295 [Taenia crassiceps]|uniref:Uncharacterized protein n=1 Tax=Taenia crassiceps TaxID=6207 RepID=A0ABR4QLE7_9CEST
MELFRNVENPLIVLADPSHSKVKATLIASFKNTLEFVGYNYLKAGRNVAVLVSRREHSSLCAVDQWPPASRAKDSGPLHILHGGMLFM